MTNDMSIKTLAMMGYPGAGKGSQAKLLAKELNFKVYSTGSECREIAKENTIIGRKVKEIAKKLYITSQTVHTYRYRIFEKLGVHNDVELTRMAMQHGLIKDGYN